MSKDDTKKLRLLFMILQGIKSVGQENSIDLIEDLIKQTTVKYYNRNKKFDWLLEKDRKAHPCFSDVELFEMYE